MAKKPLIVFDCDGPMANPQYLINHMCMHMRIPVISAAGSKHFEIDKALGCSKKEAELVFEYCLRTTFSAEHYHPVDDSVEAILTLSLFFDWVICTARATTEKTINWATRVYNHTSNKPVPTFSAIGSGVTLIGRQEGKTKPQVCKELEARFIVEDNPREIRDILESGLPIEPICVPYRYNECIARDFPEVFRAPYPQITQYLLGKLG